METIPKYNITGSTAIFSRKFIRQKQSGKRRRPNPLRFAGRVFNFQDHQYVPQNPPAMLLQSLWPCSPLSFYLALSSLFFSVTSRDQPAFISLALTLIFLSSLLYRCRPSSRGMLYIYHFNKPSAIASRQQMNAIRSNVFTNTF